MDPRWAPWGAASAAVCTWPSNLPISIPSCSCTAVSNCTGHIAFEMMQEFVIAVQDHQSVLFDICDAKGAPNAPTATLKGKSARVFYGRCPNRTGWYAAFDSSNGAGNYVMSLSGKANGTLSLWSMNNTMPLWPNSTAVTPGESYIINTYIPNFHSHSHSHSHRLVDVCFAGNVIRAGGRGGIGHAGGGVRHVRRL